MNKAEQLIACLEGEIAKRDAELERLRAKTTTTMGVGRGDGRLFIHGDYESVKAAQGIVIERDQLRAELAAIKAQEPVIDAPYGGILRIEAGNLLDSWVRINPCKLYAAPVSEAKAQEQVAIEFRQFMTDVVTGAGLLSCGKQSKGLAAELSANAYKYLLGAPVHEAKSQGVVQWPEADEIMQMAFEEGQPADDASGYCFELEEFDLFIERLMSEVANLNAAPVQQVSVPDERAAFEREDRYIVIKRSDMDRIPNQKVVHSFLGALGELSAHSVRIPQRKFLVIESDWPEYDPAWKLIQDRVQGRPILDAAPAAPAADAYPHGHPLHREVFMALESWTGSDTFEDGVRALIAALSAHRSTGVV